MARSLGIQLLCHCLCSCLRQLHAVTQVALCLLGDPQLLCDLLYHSPVYRIKAAAVAQEMMDPYRFLILIGKLRNIPAHRIVQVQEAFFCQLHDG